MARMKNGLRYIDSDGHILEHPTAMPDYAPEEFRERIWHIETDTDGTEWAVFNGQRTPANRLALAGTAGMADEDRERAMRGELRYTEVRPAAYNAKARLHDMDEDGIDLAVLYPTTMLGIQANPDVEFAGVQCRAYNDWVSDHTQEGEGRLFAAGAVPPMPDASGVDAVAAEIHRVAELRGMVGVFLRPNPSVEWRPFNDPVYDPIWTAAEETGIPLGFHPFLMPDLPGAVRGLKLDRARDAAGSYVPLDEMVEGQNMLTNVYFTQAIGNPVDVMHAICYLTAGGVCERFPGAKFIFLEANGGWLVPWLERLDHHAKKFQWDVPWLTMLPSEYFRRQCWISFDPDEAMLAFTASSPLCGADRIIWASDYPHPDAKFPGVTDELTEAIAPLDEAQQRQITSESARALYGIG
jgi:predicted TIM-barrel fold metal-dependent hydrolase